SMSPADEPTHWLSSGPSGACPHLLSDRGPLAIGWGGMKKCQSAARTPPATVLMLCPLADTAPRPTTAKRPSVARRDHRCMSLPAGTWSVLGKVSGTGGAKAT